ncbi:MAG: hypothetical protein MK183_03115 [Verrucomicrobiales bacterium]|nr:hypothetical protein [Verrucomicrobiales bacterium]
MPDPHHQRMTCPECHTQFTVPSNEDENSHASCPNCGKVVMSGDKTTTGESDGKRPGIPAARKSFNFELPEMIITHSGRNKKTGKRPLPSVGTGNPGNADNIPDTSRQYARKPINWETEPVHQHTAPSGADDASPDRQLRFKKMPRQHKYPAKVWAAFLVIAVLLMIAASVILKQNKRKLQEEPVAEQAPSQQLATPKVQERIEGKPQPIANPQPAGPIQAAISEFGIRGTYEKASTVLKSFLNADSLEKRKKFTRSIQRVGLLMDKYYETRDPGVIKHHSLTDYSNSSTLENFYLIGVTLDDFSSTYGILTIEQGRFMVDWEAFVGYSEMTLDQFKADKTQSPTLFRLRVKPDDYFNFDFTPDKYQCLQLSDIEEKTVLYGYVIKGTGPISSLQPGQEEFFTLRLRYPEQPKAANQVFIEEVITSGWVIE